MEHDDLNIATLAPYFSDEAAAWTLMESLRWPDGPMCPHCGETGRAYLLKPRSGQRITAKGTVSYRRWWKCGGCRKQFSVLVGTIFENTKVPLAKWLLVIYMMVSSKNGVAANEIRRTLKVSDRTAWHMLHRVREAMKQGPLADMLRGTIVADETWIGGNPQNRHGRSQAARSRMEPERVEPGHGNLVTDKTPVLSVVDKESGEVRSRVVRNVDGPTLRKVMAEQIDMAGSHLQTDEGSWYRAIGQEFASHETVNHKSGEYGRGNISTNRAEGYFGQIKPSIVGTHRHVSKAHLHRYLAEFDFRYSTCKLSDSERMRRLMGQTGGRRLRYQALTQT